MDDVDHDDIDQALCRQRQKLRVGHQIEPRRERRVGGDAVAGEFLEVARAAADFQRMAGNAMRRHAAIEVIVDGGARACAAIGAGSPRRADAAPS
jgi:hypothetical protein